jgi:hypothetical protein
VLEVTRVYKFVILYVFWHTEITLPGYFSRNLLPKLARKLLLECPAITITRLAAPAAQEEYLTEVKVVVVARVTLHQSAARALHYLELLAE